MFLTTTIKRGNLGPVWDKPVPGRWLCFCLNFLSICCSSLVAFGDFTFQKLLTNQPFGLEFCAVQQDTFYPHQDYEQLISTKNRVFISLAGPSETGKSQLFYNWLKNGIFQAKFDKIYFFYQHSQPLHEGTQKEIGNLEFVLGVNFEYIDSLKNNCKKYLLRLTILVKRFAIQRPLLTLPPLGDIGVWAQSTLNITFFTKAN